MIQQPVTWLEISRSALDYNIKQFKKILPKQTQFMAVVKSNAYGHGLVATAKIAIASGAHWLATVNLEEALELRANNLRCPILVLSYFNPSKLTKAIKKKITLTIYSYGAANQLNQIGKRYNQTVKIHIKIDTGTSRLGLLSGQSLEIIKKIAKLPYIKIEGIFSHFADAENPNQSFTNKQLDEFNSLLAKLKKEGISIPLKHFACSAATLLNKQSYFNLVRIGISLYGLWSVENDGSQVKKLHSQFKIKPALSWYTKIIQLKELPPKTSIGYGRTYRTTKKVRLALIPVGYWEGYDRKLSNKGQVLVHGRRCKIRGRVCMNLTMVDVTSLKNVSVGDRVTLIGKDGKQEITADEIAKKTDTINYEVVTRINPQLTRIYV